MHAACREPIGGNNILDLVFTHGLPNLDPSALDKFPGIDQMMASRLLYFRPRPRTCATTTQTVNVSYELPVWPLFEQKAKAHHYCRLMTANQSIFRANFLILNHGRPKGADKFFKRVL